MAALLPYGIKIESKSPCIVICLRPVLHDLKVTLRCHSIFSGRMAPPPQQNSWPKLSGGTILYVTPRLTAIVTCSQDKLSFGDHWHTFLLEPYLTSGKALGRKQVLFCAQGYRQNSKFSCCQNAFILWRTGLGNKQMHTEAKLMLDNSECYKGWKPWGDGDWLLGLLSGVESGKAFLMRWHLRWGLWRCEHSL